MTDAILDLPPSELRAELLERAAAQQQGHSNDVDNTQWLACLIAIHGWPSRRQVGTDGVIAALELAARAPLPYQRGWIPKITNAIRAASVPARAARDFIDQAVGTGWTSTPR
jgi:hypothetical protein